jgi:glycosyltransferase involved in cell wall biosynthesis
MKTESQSIDQTSEVSQPPRLEKPVRITDQAWPEGTVPVVSIWCITFNHANFIRDAIEGFLMQETTFPSEILIHDDASTDGTADIVREYQAKYPQLIRTVLQTENQWSKGIKPRSVLDPMVRGEFIALCEGDDYWIKKDKLQKQVEILDKDRSASLVFHNAWVSHAESRRDYFLNRGIKQNRFSLNEVIECNWFMATASMVSRKCSPVPVEISQYSMVGDMLFQIGACMHGDAVYLDEVCSVYRRHEGGISDELWREGDFHHEKFRPNNIWMYWMLGERFLPACSRLSVECRIRDLVTYILRYAAVHKGASRDYSKLTAYLWDALRKNKPEFVSDDIIEEHSALRAIVDSQIRVFWKMHRKQQLRNVTNRLLKPILKWLQ